MQVRRTNVEIGTRADGDWWIIFGFRMALADNGPACLEHPDRSTMYEHAKYDKEVVDWEEDFSEVLAIGGTG